MEIILFDETLSGLIADGAAQTPLRKAAQCRGFPTLWDQGIEKVLAGKTTFAEIDRAIGVYA